MTKSDKHSWNDNQWNQHVGLAEKEAMHAPTAAKRAEWEREHDRRLLERGEALAVNVGAE